MRTLTPFSTASLLTGALLALVGSDPGGAQELRYSGSLGFFTGSYIFADQTESISLLNGVDLSFGRFSLSAALPIIAQTSQAVAFLGGGMMPTGGPDHGSESQGHSGTGMGMGEHLSDAATAGSFETTIGDPLVRGSYRLVQGSGPLRSLTVEGMAKAPLAPVSSGIGTGAWDFGVGASATTAVGMPLLLGSVAFWSPGDLPELALKKYAGFSVGAGLMLGRRWSVLSSLNVSTAIIETIDPPASVGLSVGFRPGSGRSLNGGLSVGLTEASPDLSVYLGWSFGFLGSRTGEVPEQELIEGR